MNLRAASASAMACLMVTAAWAASPATAPAAPSGDAGQIARGKYLANMGDCAACHTAPNGQYMAGGLGMRTPFGTIMTPNITPDRETGIGDWSGDDFYKLFHEGVAKDGSYIYPAMPYPWFRHVTRDDVLAIRAYLFTLAPVHAPKKPNDLTFPFNIRAGLAVWDAAFLKGGEWRPDPKKSAEVNRGDYIVNGLGHCGECHNGNNLLGNTGASNRLAGAALDHWYAPNISSDFREGIGRYSDAQLFAYLKTGTAQGMGVANGPMAQTVHESLRKMTDGDIHAIIAYLRQTPAKEPYKPEKLTAFAGAHPEGAQAYGNHCASCHQTNGQGIPNIVPSLVHDVAVTAKGPEDVIRAIVGGIQAQNSYAPMPAVGSGMTDQEVADATNYVRQSWGNEAPPTAAPGMVATLRKITPRMLALSQQGGGCDKRVTQKELAPVLNDPNSPIIQSMKQMTLATMLPTVERIIPEVRRAAPNASQADIVNSLTLAYCPIVRDDPRVPAAMKVTQLDQFGERIYTQLVAKLKE